jgi:hypothetical protein
MPVCITRFITIYILFFTIVRHVVCQERQTHTRSLDTLPGLVNRFQPIPSSGLDKNAY